MLGTVPYLKDPLNRGPKLQNSGCTPGAGNQKDMHQDKYNARGYGKTHLENAAVESVNACEVALHNPRVAGSRCQQTA